MSEQPIIILIEPKCRGKRRAIDNEINRAINDFNDIENLFLSVLFSEDLDMSYEDLYLLALKDWANVAKMGYKLNRFLYTCPNIRYFEEKYKPLERGH